MIDNLQSISSFIDKGKGHVHFVGVCGIGMAGLAFLFKSLGFHVTGCDASCNNLSGWLDSRGVTVFAGHDREHISSDVDIVVKTAAVGKDHPEILEAGKRGVPVAARGAVLAELARRFFSVCVCGTHGKTSVAAMLAQGLRDSGRSPWFAVGAECAGLSGVAGEGDERILVAEADESDATLSLYQPDVLVVTNIEFDHAETFADVEALKHCFRQAVENTKLAVVYCADDPLAVDVCAGAENAVGYGFSENADVRLFDFVERQYSCEFKLAVDGDNVISVSLPVAGRHNALNAAAALTSAAKAGVGLADFAGALSAFVPARRRFEKIIDTPELLVVSDYAHHPSEIITVVSSAEKLGRSGLTAVFQPHRFTRTKALLKDFPPAFDGVDQVVLLPVYAASEPVLRGGSSLNLYELLRARGKYEVVYAHTLEGAWRCVKRMLKPGDALLVVGAGSVDDIARLARRATTGRAVLPPDSGTELRKEIGGLRLVDSELKSNEPMAAKTTLRVGGMADVFFRAGSLADLQTLAAWCGRNNVVLRALGAGSNVLISDAGAGGVVIRLGKQSFGRIALETNTLVAGAAAGLNELTSYCAERGLGGFEFLSGIPGTVGGALRMNAGAMGAEIGDLLRWVEFVDKNGVPGMLRKDELSFAYRSCAQLEDVFVTRAGFRFDTCSPETVKKTLADIAAGRSWMRGLPCAGSIFKNPDGCHAGKLLEESGAKSFKIGGASVAERHANVIVTGPGATGSDVAALMHKMREAVAERFGVELTTEVVCFE